jgi:hypothetical protein
MIGVVALFAAAATIEAPAHFRGAAREDAPHSPVVGGAKVLLVGAGVARPILTKQL